MAEFEHLPLPRIKETLYRRKKPGRGPKKPERNYQQHSNKLSTEAQKIVADSRLQKNIPGINPVLVIRSHSLTSSTEKKWVEAGFAVLQSDSDNTLVLSTSDMMLNKFNEKLSSYSLGIPQTEGRKNPDNSDLFCYLEEISLIPAKDRIGSRFKNNGLNTPEDFEGNQFYTVNIELWDVFTPNDKLRNIEQFISYIEDNNGSVNDKYIGLTGAILIRAELPGTLLLEVINLLLVRKIDIPPIPDIEMGDNRVEKTIYDFGITQAPPEDAPRIGLIDSGVSANPLLEPAILENFGVPESLGNADDYGHGTPVGGICVYGDVTANKAQGVFRPPFWICSAKVVDETGNFPADVLVETQMKNAIEKLAQMGCRVINMSLADRHNIYNDGKVSVWAATLDELSREYDVLIIVSAGNGAPPKNDQAVLTYPYYLNNKDNRIYEPATACNVISVGALSHTNGINLDHIDYLDYQVICEANEPSPFTRVGPGVNGAIKPDLIDYGGTQVFRGGNEVLLSGSSYPSAGIETLNAKYLNGLFASRSGTSFAAPLVSYKAALLLRKFPNASANLLRALLAVSADIPSEAKSCLEKVEQDKIASISNSICGYGLSDVERALNSEDNRVILYAMDSLQLDQFAVFEVPMLNQFREKEKQRHIRITLAYDPPTRHTRNDYLGVNMNFKLMRNMSLDDVIDFFRERSSSEETVGKLSRSINDVKLQPGPSVRNKSTLQSATFAPKAAMEDYGDPYYLVVRCENKWAKDLIAEQNYAVVVEMKHESFTQLHEKTRERVHIREQI